MERGYRAHAAPMQLVFYKGGSFPRQFVGDAFVTMRGSWNRKPAAGYEIVRVRFAGGQAQSVEPFVSGFLSDGGTTHFGRPVGLAVARDGLLLMADDADGVISGPAAGLSAIWGLVPRWVIPRTNTISSRSHSIPCSTCRLAPSAMQCSGP